MLSQSHNALITNAQLEKLSKSWPKFKLCNFHKMLKKSTCGAKGCFQGNKNTYFMKIGVDLFSVQANKQSIVSSNSS